MGKLRIELPMKIDLSQPAPRVHDLKQAQALIDELWTLLRCQEQQIEGQAQQIQAQRIRIEEQDRRIEALEERLNANSRNSSRPPSSDEGKACVPKGRSGRKAGGQPGHQGKARLLCDGGEVTHRSDCYPEAQCACGGTVEELHLIKRHQVVELPPIVPMVMEYRLHAGRCQGCGQYHEASLPAGVSAGMAGPRLLALMGTLTGGYHLSRRLVQSLLADVFRIEVSVGTISQGEPLLSAALASSVAQAHEWIKQAQVIHADETSHREKGRLQWMWVAIAGRVSLFLARTARSAEAARELLGDFTGILVSDRYAAYGWLPAHRRQVCWAHLQRDFTKIAERSGIAGQVGAQLLDNTRRIFGFWHRVRDGTLSREEFAMHMQFLQLHIETALKKGSSCGCERTENTCAQILKVREALWTFVRTPGVEPTNNLAERTLRSYVIWRKICFGAQSRRGSLYMERMMTVIGSCKLQARNVLEFVTQSVQALFGYGSAPSLIPVTAS